MRRILPFCLFAIVAATGPAMGQQVDVMNYRTIDGRYNNLDHPEWGAAHTRLPRIAPATYADGISAPTGINRPNPREVSNVIFSQNGLINDPFNLSDFCWVFGQFMDHDFGLTTDINEPLMISVPKGDPWFDPMGTGRVVIPMKRNSFDPATGTSAANPREHMNTLTSYMDGSGVYGSDEDRARWLRSFTKGKLKVSAGNLPPYNTTTGEFADPIDPTAPHMDNATGAEVKLFVAGDSRANENPLLLAFHTIFVREHNRQAELLAKAHPEWTDEQLYQYARKFVSGIIQNIVFHEWLPALGVHLPEYTGYNPALNASVTNEFTAAAFRLGHTLLNSNLQRVMPDGTPYPGGPVALRDAFFNLNIVRETGGIEPFLQGMGVQIQQQMDAKVVDDVRNFLFGPPGAGGLDLASININRGRERGLIHFNALREALGLRPYSVFQQLNYSNKNVSQLMLSTYRNINNIDPWVGMLAEQRMPGAIFGETLMAMFNYTFIRMRDGDRFYFENDPLLTASEKALIRKTTFHDVIMNNTGIKLMQDNVFAAMDYAEICAHMTVDVSAKIRTETGSPIANVKVLLGMGAKALEGVTNSEGVFSFESVAGCDVESLNVAKEGDDHANGLTTLDLILIQKHILGRELLDSPYKIIAADVDNSGSVTTLDMIKMRKVILGIDTQLHDGSSWKFIIADYPFSDNQNPFLDNFPTEIVFSDLLGRDYLQEYIAVKQGDVNNSAQLSGNIRNEALAVNLSLADVRFASGQEIRIPVRAEAETSLQGFQLAFGFDPAVLEFQALVPGVLPGISEDNFGVFTQEGLLTGSWNHAALKALTVKPGEVLFTLVFRTIATGQVSKTLYLNRRAMRAEAYAEDLQIRPLQVVYQPQGADQATTFRLFQNQPNPFLGQTVIPFYLPEAGTVRLRVMDAAGRVLLQRETEFAAGYQQWDVTRNELGASGLLYYRIETAQGQTATGKMVAE